MMTSRKELSERFFFSNLQLDVYTIYLHESHHFSLDVSERLRQNKQLQLTIVYYFSFSKFSRPLYIQAPMVFYFFNLLSSVLCIGNKSFIQSYSVQQVFQDDKPRALRAVVFFLFPSPPYAYEYFLKPISITDYKYQWAAINVIFINTFFGFGKYYYLSI